MDFLRKALKWVNQHKIVSLLLAVFIVAIFYGVKFIMVRMEGVTSGPIRRATIVDAVYGIGTVTANQSYAVKTGITSTLSELFVKEGDSVKKGDRLARVDQIIYRAPFAGVVNYLPYKVGENIFPQTPLLVVTNLRDRFLVVFLEQQGAVRVQPGQKAKVSFDSMRERNYDGTVISTYSYNGNFIARIDVPSLPPEILPDMTADVAIIVRNIPEALVIPVAAYEDGFVWVRRGRGIPQKIPVTLGVVDQTMAQVLQGGLQEGDQVMIRRKVTP